ncbi:MAG: universal stress protein [Gaiella sp.]
MHTNALRAATIAVGVDGGETSWRALSRAVNLCGYGSRLSVCVVQGPREQSSLEPLLDGVRRMLIEHLLTASVTPLDGEPWSALVAHAREITADLLVVGRTRAPAEAPHLDASFEAALLATAPCDLLVVG